MGCGKAYLLHEMKLLLPGLRVVGFDISNHGLADASNICASSCLMKRCDIINEFAHNVSYILI